MPSSIIKIGKFAFKDCINLISVTIPEGVTEIEDSRENNIPFKED